MSNPTLQPANVINNQRKRLAYAFIDGFNMYHALDHFPHAPDTGRYRKYKWLCFRSLMSQFLDSESEELGCVFLFTAFPNWPGSEAKSRRHQTFVDALKIRGVETILGEFKKKIVECKGTCCDFFEGREEKQTDVNIATSIIQKARDCDILMLVTADSDQVPAVRLFRELYPLKSVYIIPPIGRNSKELVRAAGRGSRKVMLESHLAAAQMPNPVQVLRDGRVISRIVKPTTW
jgi:uncharacterized LabA/DUF88 family protein